MTFAPRAHLISRAYAMANADPPRGAEAERRAQATFATAWHQHGIAMMRVEEIADDWLRQAITNELNRRYGARIAPGPPTRLAGGKDGKK